MERRDELKEYRAKRDLKASREPAGGARSRRPRFVVQEHHATTRHFDFRLEVGGVLKSWVVPKGPSTDPRQRRLALPTEDHPLGYADFEGVIPEGHYGAGRVLVWDAGPYRNLREDDMATGLGQGQVEVWLEGQKLRGGYALVRTATGKDERWLLIKMKDEGADARRRPIRTEPRSVKSGLTIEELEEESS